MEPIDTLVTRLQRANWAYHNGGEILMSDDEYDRQLEELKRRSPSHPFLRVIGASVGKNGTILPVVLGSLDKMRYGEGSLERWMKKQKNAFIVSEKLDGLSALYVCNGRGKRMLYLRGDGVRGVDVSRIFNVVAFPPHKCMIRGEVVLPNERTPEGSIGRSLVNGWLHRCLDEKAEVPIELKGVHFVGYQVFEPEGMTRDQQITWLKERGFRVPWTMQMTAEECGEDMMKTLLLGRKRESNYPLDGLVIGVNSIPQKVEGEAKNPDDSVAFKAALDEQKREATVVRVEWNVSRQGLLIPRIEIEPVEIGGAKIQWISGHNAAAIVEGCIGKGARVLVRRSGDVIPMVEEVIEGATSGKEEMPEGSWEWDENRVHVRRKKDDTQITPEEAAVICMHGLQTMGVEGMGPGLVRKLVDAGMDTMKKIWNAKENALASAIGGGRGPELKRKLQDAYKAANQGTLLLASNLLPRGVGEKKLRALYAVEGDARKWKTKITKPQGWSKETYDELLESLPKVFGWIESTFGEIRDESTFGEIPLGQPIGEIPLGQPIGEIRDESTFGEIPLGQPIGKSVTNGKTIVFTGVRDKELEGRYEGEGWTIGDAVNKKTTILCIADGAKATETVKMKKAKELGVKILTLTECKDFLEGR